MKAYLAVTAALLISACGNTTPPAATITVTPTTQATQSMTEWKHGIADQVGSMGEALDTTGTAMVDQNLPAMRIGCTQLRAAVDDLDRELPSPNPKVTAALNDTIDDYRSMAQLCMTIQPGGMTELNEMERLFNRGKHRMDDAINLMS